MVTKINEAEDRVGITKRNIRYYEKEGLLSPGRNSDNGYRDYTDEDVLTLKKIKLLRKLDVPLEEIRSMQQGVLTLEDGMRRHMIQLHREQENLLTMQCLCKSLVEAQAQLPNLDADLYLEEMQRMEGEGTKFMNIKKHDTITRYAGPVIAALVFLLMMVGVLFFIFWAVTVAPADAPPLGLLIFLVALPVLFILGVLLALYQRIKQIRGGEEDAASQY